MTTTNALTAVIDPTPARDVPTGLDRLRTQGLIALGAWLVLFLAWALWAPISGAVVGGGLVKVEANRQTISHRDGGIVAKLHVREGQVVERGQALLVLEDARIDSTVDLLSSQIEAERLRKMRLEAEMALRPTWSPPPLADAGLRLREALQRERAAFEARQRALQGQLEATRSQIADTEAEIRAHDRDHAAATEALRLQREELAANEALVKDSFVNRVRIGSLQRAVADYESRVELNRAERAKAVQKQTELQGRLTAARDGYLRTAAEELRDATARVVDLEERLRAARDAATRQVITAPVAGRLVDLKVNTIGSAVGPREPIVDIVPADVPLVVEVKVGADAAGDVRVGQAAEVSLMSYRKREIGMLQATVRRVSADALIEPRSGAAYFAVQVEVAPEELARYSKLVLLPGMAAEVYIKTQERTALEFLMDPLTMAMRRSFREH